jgi:hypothetical protein
MEFSHFEKEIIDIVLKFCKDKAVIEELLQLVLNYADQKESKKL